MFVYVVIYTYFCIYCIYGYIYILWLYLLDVKCILIERLSVVIHPEL